MNKINTTLSRISVFFIVLAYFIIGYDYTQNIFIQGFSATLYILGMSILLYFILYTDDTTPINYNYILSKMDIIASWTCFVALGLFLHVSGYISKEIFSITWILFVISLFIFSYLSFNKEKNKLIVSNSGVILVAFSVFLLVYFRQNNIFRPNYKINIQGLNIAILFYAFGWGIINYAVTV